jgi:hypothetical protein
MGGFRLHDMFVQEESKGGSSVFTGVVLDGDQFRSRVATTTIVAPPQPLGEVSGRKSSDASPSHPPLPQVMPNQFGKARDR